MAKVMLRKSFGNKISTKQQSGGFARLKYFAVPATATCSRGYDARVPWTFVLAGPRSDSQMEAESGWMAPSTSNTKRALYDTWEFISATGPLTLTLSRNVEMA